jgi:hypothetical protein
VGIGIGCWAASGVAAGATNCGTGVCWTPSAHMAAAFVSYDSSIGCICNLAETYESAIRALRIQSIPITNHCPQVHTPRCTEKKQPHAGSLHIWVPHARQLRMEHSSPGWLP